MATPYSLYRLLRPARSARVVYVNPCALEHRAGYITSSRGYSPVTVRADLPRARMVICAHDPLAWRLKTSEGHGDRN